ncbi:hypothetical protein AZF01_06405 [Martelella sp. AD-3]|nr:hypothetical protein AZF01_06405 [Martelella sp. AD-3]
MPGASDTVGEAVIAVAFAPATFAFAVVLRGPAAMVPAPFVVCFLSEEDLRLQAGQRSSAGVAPTSQPWAPKAAMAASGSPCLSAAVAGT